MARQFLSKPLMALIVTRCLYGIASRVPDSHVTRLPQYKLLVRKSWADLKLEFLHAVNTFGIGD